MSKKIQQIISFTMALLLIVSSLDTSVLATELSIIETAEEQTADELETSSEISNQKQECAENNSLEIEETQNEETSVEKMEINNSICEENSSETVLDEESETYNTKTEELPTETSSPDETTLENETKSDLNISETSSEYNKINIDKKITLSNNYELNNNNLYDLLNSYFSLLGYGFTEYNEELFLKYMEQDVFSNMLRRLGILDEKQIAIHSVSYEVTQYNEDSNELLVQVTESINCNTLKTLHVLTVSNNNKSEWKIESDLFDDTDISGIRTDGKEISLYSFSSGYPNTWSNTGNQARDISQIALTQVGYTETNANHTKYNSWYYDSDTSAQWCAIFISWCANQAGISKSIIKPNAWAGYTLSGMSQNGFGVPAYSFSSTSARVGDIAFINNDSDSKSDHVGLIYAVDSNYIYTVEGNYSNKVSKCKYSASTGSMVSPKVSSGTTIMFYGRPNYANNAPNNSSPIGNLDGIEGGKGTVTLVGWAADPDDYARDVEIHIYVGGNIGVGSLYNVTANNALRSDVKQEHPLVKENCGFNYTFKVNERGTQEVYVYALDTQGTSLNTLIGHTTITIANPDPGIHIDPDSLQLNVNDTKKLTVSYQISETYKLNCYIADTDIASAEWGTPANSICDLNIKGLKKGNTTVDVQLWNVAMTTLIYNETIPITVTELSVEFSQDTVETNLNEIKTFKFSFAGSDLYGLECEIDDRSIIELTGWEWDKNNNGTINIKGYKKGTTNLTVCLMGANNTKLFSKSIPITVIIPSVSFSQNSIETGVNETEEITFSFRGANLQDIGLDIADQSIAALEGWEWDEDNNGTIKVKGHKKGTTTMTLYIVGADGSRLCSKTISITVKDSLSGITLNASSKEITVGSSFQLAVSYIPSTAKPEGTVQWASSNTDVAIVDTHGRVKALKKGTTIITASVDGFRKECRITVIEEQVPVTGIRLNASDIFIKEGTQYALTVTYTPSNANTNIPSAADIVWSSQNTKIATVNNGIIKAIRSGSTTITAKYGIYSATCKVTVMENEEESSKVEESSDTRASSENSSEESSVEEPESNNETTSESEETSKSETESMTERPSESEETSESETESKEPAEDETNNKISIKQISDMVYTGTAVKPDLEVYNGTNKLYLNKDYTVSYKSNTNVGTAFVTVKGKGNYSDKVTISFNILPKNLSDSDIIAEDLALVANHKIQKKIPAVSHNGKKLKINKDFTASFGTGDFQQEGTYIVTLSGTGNYTGTIKAKIILTDKKNLIKNAKLTYQSKQTYTGKEITPSVTVMCNNSLLTNGKDYAISYVNNIKPGKANIVITGKGSYAGTKTAKFTIKKDRTVLTEQMVITQPTMAYVKGGCFLKPLVICDGKTLVLGNDYTVSYKNNKSVGLAIIQIKGKGTYSGTVEKSFTISPQNINKVSVRVPDIAYNEKTGNYISTPILMDSDGTMLKLNKDYGNITYSINGSKTDSQSKPALGSVITVNLSGIGNYTGTVTVKYQLRKTSFSKAKIVSTPKTYTGTTVTLNPSDLHVTLNGETLIYGKDYEIVKGTYKNNTKKGQGSVVIKGLGEFAGEKTVKFRITAKPIK